MVARKRGSARSPDRPRRTGPASRGAGEATPTYEPPRLTRLGSLRELVGKSGGQMDNPPTGFARRP